MGGGSRKGGRRGKKGDEGKGSEGRERRKNRATWEGESGRKEWLKGKEEKESEGCQE